MCNKAPDLNHLSHLKKQRQRSRSSKKQLNVKHQMSQKKCSQKPCLFCTAPTELNVYYLQQKSQVQIREEDFTDVLRTEVSHMVRPPYERHLPGRMRCQPYPQISAIMEKDVDCNSLRMNLDPKKVHGSGFVDQRKIPVTIELRQSSLISKNK